MRMARVNVYLPDKLFKRAKHAKLSVSELSQRAIREELLRRERMQALEEFVGALEDEQGPATPDESAAAETWAAEVLAAAQQARDKPARPRRAKPRRTP